MKTLKYFFLVLVVLAGCARFPNPLVRIRPDYSMVPEDELRAFALKVETSVFNGEREPDLGSYTSLAAENEEVRQAIRTRAARAHLIKAFLDTGFAYEQKSGTIAIIRSREYKKATDSRKRDQNALLVMSENANRWALYEALVKASNWPPAALGTVQHTFYEARVSVMNSGWKYETPDGSIVVK